MATISVNELDTSKITLTPPAAAAKGGMNICKILYDNTQPLTVTLAQDLCLSCPFQPSAYKAVGSEERLGIVIRATDEMHDCFVALEEHCRKLLQADGIEKVDTLWCSSAREDDFGKALRANINITGSRAADFWDPNNEQTKAPEDFKAISFNAMCQVRGVYMMKASMGLLLDIRSVQYNTVTKPKPSPFLSKP